MLHVAAPSPGCTHGLPNESVTGGSFGGCPLSGASQHRQGQEVTHPPGLRGGPSPDRGRVLAARGEGGWGLPYQRNQCQKQEELAGERWSCVGRGRAAALRQLSVRPHGSSALTHPAGSPPFSLGGGGPS